MIKRQNRVIKYTDFPEISEVVSYVADFFIPYTNEIMSHIQFMRKYNLQISENKYIDVRYILNLALQKLKIPCQKLLPAIFPAKPLLIDIATMTKKGCGIYYRILSSKQNLTNKIHIRENKWHLVLNSTFSIHFWDKARRLCASINNDNPIKWLQYQILRNCLQTNYIVNHFKPTVIPKCTFCKITFEKISHLFWSCCKVTEFLADIFAFVCSTGITFAPNKAQFIFGYLDLPYNDPKNYLILNIKKFIWLSKFKYKSLSFVGFKNYFKHVLNELKVLYGSQKNDKFNVWNNLFSNLLL